MSKGKFALGALFGTAVGLVAGFLTAPKSGKDTIADIKVKADEAKSDMAEKTECYQSEAIGMVDDAKSKTQDVAKDIKTEAINLKKRTERAIEGAEKGFNEKDKK